MKVVQRQALFVDQWQAFFCPRMNDDSAGQTWNIFGRLSVDSSHRIADAIRDTVYALAD